MASVPLKLSQLAEKILLAVGCVLLLVYAGSQLDSLVMYHAGLWSFHAHQLPPSVVHAADIRAADSKVDFALWSVKRIQAYKSALALKVDPPLAVLIIPRVNLEVPVYNGTDDLTLNRGVGRIAGTASPGEQGNLGIAGHRDGFFRGLKDIHIGDQIDLFSGRTKYVYKVDNVVIVSPTDTSVLRPSPVTSLTLVTCYPFYFLGDAPQRYIVHASLVDRSHSTASSLNSAVQPQKSEDTP